MLKLIHRFLQFIAGSEIIFLDHPERQRQQAGLRLVNDRKLQTGNFSQIGYQFPRRIFLGLVSLFRDHNGSIDFAILDQKNAFLRKNRATEQDEAKRDHSSFFHCLLFLFSGVTKRRQEGKFFVSSNRGK